jgi:enoyl-CoA hydratase
MGYIDYELKEGVGLVTFSRPEALNALSVAGVEEALRFFEELGGKLAGPAGPAGPHAIVLTGAGKAFIAGADVREMARMSPPEASRFSSRGSRLMNTIERLPVPVIAAVNGYALGGGFEVALAADFMYAASGAKLGLPEVTLGIIPGFGGVRRLCRRIGTARAKELVYTGRQITAEEALALGIVNRLAPADGLLALALQAAAELGNAGRQALRAAKRHADECLLLDAEAAAALEAERFGALFAGGEPAEGMNALLAKRKPAWARKEG